MQTGTPNDIVRTIAAKADVVRTPCGDGEMVWHCWDGPDDRPPLVLLHGGFGSWTHWIANVEYLSQSRRVVACDTPGLGDSASAPGKPSPYAIAQPIADGLDAVIGKGRSFDLAGFSFGGLIGARVSAIVGDRMRTYVAVGASGFAGLHVAVEGVQAPSPKMSDAELDVLHRRNLAILLIWDEAKIDDLAVFTHRENVARARVASRRMSLGNHLADSLPEMKARLAGIWGVHDATGGGREAILERRDVMAQFRDEVPFTIIEDSGHWVMYETPDEFNAALVEILDS